MVNHLSDSPVIYTVIDINRYPKIYVSENKSTVNKVIFYLAKDWLLLIDNHIYLEVRSIHNVYQKFL